MFDEQYEAILADTEESKKIHYNLRYQVYCLEKQYEDEGDCPGQMEADEYDEDAVHFLVREKQTGEWVATVRLVLGSLQELPMKELVNIDQERINSGDELLAEISRFSILNTFRNNTGSVKRERIKEPEIMLGMFRAVIEYGKNNGISNWLFLCRRSLKRIMNQCGFSVEVVGPKTNHKGTRYPYLVSLEKSFDQLKQLAPSIGSMFSKRIAYYRYSEMFESMDCAA